MRGEQLEVGGMEDCRALKSETKLRYLYALVITFADYYRGNGVMQLINTCSSVSNIKKQINCSTKE